MVRVRTAWLTRDFVGTPPNLSPGGCAFYRCYLPMAALNWSGSALGAPVYDPIRGYGIRESESVGVFGYDTVVLKLIMDRQAPTQMRLAKNNARQRFIVDIDDYYQGLTPANKAYDLSHPEKNKRSNRDFYEEVIQTADRLTVSTPFLLEYYRDKHPDVRMVRNGVNVQMFDQVLQNEKPVIGWTGSTAFRNNDLEQLQEWLPDFLEEHDLVFHHAGASDNAPSFSDITGVNPDRVRTSPLLPITHYASGFQFDIGIVPLNDIPFNHAKSNIKGLEYAAAGIPFVASDVPEYRVLHEDGVGMLAQTADDWRSQMNVLLSRTYRMKTAKRASDTVSERWSIQARASEWAEALTP